MCDCFHLAFPNWHGPATGPGRRLRGPEQDLEDDSVFEEPEILEGERPRPQGSSPVEEFPAEKQVEEDLYDSPHKSKKTRRIGFGSLFDKRSTAKMSEDIQSGESGVVMKTVKEACAEGLVLTGGGREGIFIKEVKPDSPASKHLSMKEGDQILSATVYFDNVSYEDALQILEHAQPYKMEICLKRKVDSTMPEDADIVHPEGNVESSPEMRTQRKMKKQQDRISWPKFPSFGRGRRAQFKRSHSTSEAEEHRKLEMSPQTSDTESPFKSPLKFPDEKEQKKKQKMQSSGKTKGYRSKSVEEPQRKGKELITENMAVCENLQVDSVEEKLPEEVTAKLEDTAHVAEETESEISSKIKQDHALSSLSEMEQQHKVHYISLGNTLKTTDISVTFAEGSAGIMRTLEEGKVERSEMKVNIHQKEKTDAGIGNQSGENIISDICASDNDGVSPVVISQAESERFQLNPDLNTQVVIKGSSEEDLVSINTKMTTPKLDDSLELFSVGELKKPQTTGGEKDLKERNVFENESYGIRIRGPLADMATTKPHFASAMDGFQFLLPECSDKKQESAITDTQEASFVIPDISQAKSKTDTSVSALDMKDLEIKKFMLPTVTYTDHLIADVDKKSESKFKLPNVDLSKFATQDPIKMTKQEQMKTSLPKREDIEIPGIEAKPCLQAPVIKVPKIEKITNITKEVKIQAHQTDEQFSVEDVKVAVSKFPAFKLPEGDVTGVLVQREVTIMEMKGDKSNITPRGSPRKISVTSADSSTTLTKSQMGKEKSSASDIADKDIGTKIPNVELHYDPEQISVAIKKLDYTKPNISKPNTDTMLITDDEKMSEVTFKLPKREDIEIPGMEAIKKSNIQKTKIKADKDIQPGEKTKTKKYGNQKGQEKKSKKAKITMPSFGITKPDIRFPDIGTDFPKTEVHKNDAGEIKIKKFEVDVPQTDTSLKDVYLPEDKDLKLHTIENMRSKSYTKYEKKEADIPIHEQFGIGKSLPDKKGPDLAKEVQLYNVDEKTQSTEMAGQGSKFKLPKFEISFPEVKVPKMHFSPSKKDTEISITEANTDMPATYAAEVEMPDAKANIKEDVPEEDCKDHEMKTKRSSFSFPKFGFSKSDTKITEADVTLKNAEGSLPERNVDVEVENTEITPSMGDKKQEDETKFGSPTKFKIPSISLPKFGAKTSKVAVDISGVEAQVPAPETGLKQAEVTVSDEPLSLNIKGPDDDKKGKFLKDIQIDGQESKFRLPKFDISFREVKGPQINLHAGKTEADISAQERKEEVHESDVEVSCLKTEVKSDKPKVDSKCQDAEIKKPVFSFPRFSFSKSETRDAESDVSLPQVDVSLPEEDVKIEKQDANIKLAMGYTGEEDTRKVGSSTKFKLPTISLPKFGTKAPKAAVDISEAEVQMKGPEINLPQTEVLVSSQPLSVDVKTPEVGKESKSVNVDINAEDIKIEGQESKIKMPKFAISFSEVKGPKIDLHGCQTTEISLPEGKGELNAPDVEGPDVKTEVKLDLPKGETQGVQVEMKKSGFSLPKIGLSRSETKTTEADVSLPQVDVSLQGQDVKIEGPDVAIKSAMHDTEEEDKMKVGSATKFKLPTITLPKFGAKAPKVAVDISRDDAQIKAPEISLPQTEVAVSSEPMSLSIKTPDIDKEVKSVTADIKAEDMKIEGQESKFKMPKFGISFPEVKGPKIDSHGSKTTDISLPEGKGKVHVPDVEMSDVKTELNLHLPKGDSKGLKVEMKKPGGSLPTVGFSKSTEASDAELSLPQVDVSLPGQDVKIEGPESSIKLAMCFTEEDNKMKPGSTTKFTLPTISHPKIGGKAPKAEVDIFGDDVQMKGPEISLPQTEVAVSSEPMSLYIKTPDIDKEVKSPTADIKAEDMKIEGQESKFKMPKFGISFPDVKGPKIDLHGSKTMTDISLPEGKGEVHVPDVEMPDVKTEVKLDLPKGETQGVQVEMKKSGFSLPKIGLSISESKGPDTDVSLPQVDVSLPGQDVKVEGPDANVNLAMGDIGEQDKLKFGSPTKFKLPTISLPKFGSKAKKESVDISGVDVQIKAPEISLPQTEVAVSSEPMSLSIKTPDIDKEVKSVTADIKAEDMKIEGQDSKFKMPKFGISFPEVKGPRIDLYGSKTTTDISLPEGKGEVHVPDVEMPDVKTEVKLDLPKGETQGVQVEMKKSGFSLPKIGLSISESKGPDTDVSLPQVDVSLPGQDVKVEGPDANVNLAMGDIGEQDKLKFGSPTKFKLPTISLPKFGSKAKKESVDISGVDVQIKAPEISLPQTEGAVSSEPMSLNIKTPDIDKEIKSVTADIKAEDMKIEGQESKFKMPKFGISFPEVKGPKIDLHGSKTTTDISLPEGKGEVHVSDVEMPDVKTEVKLDLPKGETQGVQVEMKKSGFSLPKIGLSKSETKAPDTDVSLPQVDVSLPGQDVKVEGPDANVDLAMGDIGEQDKLKFGSPTKFKLPTISLPKFGSKAKKESVDISGVDVQIKAPEISLPQTEVAVSSEPMSLNIKTPDIDKEIKSVTAVIKAEDIKIEGQESKFKMPKFGISFPEVKGPKIDLHGSKTTTDISLPEGKGDVHVPDVEMPDVKTEVKLDLPKGETQGVQVEMKKSGFSLPKIGLSKSETKAPDTDVSLPQVDVSLQGQDVKVEGPDANVNLAMGDIGEQDKLKFGSPTKFKLPTISFPKFGSKAKKESVDISGVDVQIKAPEISLPQTEVAVSSEPMSLNIKTPDIDKEVKSVTADIKAEDMKIEGQESKFKMPKFGISFPEVKGPKIDLHGSKTTTDISLPEGKGDVHVPDVEMPDVKTEVKLDLPKGETQGVQVEMKKSGFSLPKIGLSKSETKAPDTDVSLPQVDVSLQGQDVKVEGPDANVNFAMGDIGEQDKLKFGSPTKFKLPTISFPKFGSKAKKESVDISGVDVQIKAPEISLPQTEVAVSSEPMSLSIKTPDIDKEVKSVTADIKAEDMKIEGQESKFKMPKFGISFPEVKGPKIDLHGSKTMTDISLPEGKGEVHAPDVERPDVKTEVKLDLPKGETQGVQVEMKKSGFSLPKIGLSKSETKTTEADVSLPQVDVSLPGQDVKVEGPDANVNLTMGDIGEQDKLKFGSPTKFTLPTISLPKFGSKAKKESVDISGVDVQIKAPEISLPQTEVAVSSEPMSLNIKTPDIDKEIKSLTADIKAEDLKIEGQESKFKMPKFGISFPQVKGPKIDLHGGKTTDISLPEGKGEVHAPDVEGPDVKTEVKLDLPKGETQGVQVEMKKSGFSLPKIGLSKSETKTTEADVSLPQVDVSLPGQDVKVEGPDANVNLTMGDIGEQDKLKFGSPTKFTLPTISLPKFGSKAKKESVDISGVDVQIKAPEISLPQTEVAVSSEPMSLNIKTPDIDKEIKSLTADIKAEDLKIEGQESKFKMPKFGISFPQVKGPKIDLHGGKTTDISLPEGKGEVHAPDVEGPDVKTEVKLDLPKGETQGVQVEMKKSGFSLPKIGLSKSETKTTEADVSLPQVDVSLPGQDVKVEGPDANVNLTMGDIGEQDKLKFGSPTKFTLPTISLPKFGSKAKKESVDISGVDVQIKAPEISLPQTEVAVSSEPMSLNIKTPDIDKEIKSLTADIKAEDLKIEGQESKFKMPKFGISFPQVKGPKIDLHGGKTTDISLPEGKGEVHAPDVEGPDVKTEVKLDLPKGETQGVQVEMKKSGFSLPKIGLSKSETKTTEADVSLPQVDVSLPGQDVKVEGPDANVNLTMGDIGEQDKLKFGSPTKFTLPTISLPKFGSKAKKESVDISGVDVQIKAPEISLPQTEVAVSSEPMSLNIKTPDIDKEIKSLTADIKAEDMKIEGQESKFKMPKFGISFPQVKGPKIDLHGGKTTDISLPEGKGEVHAPDVEGPDVKSEVKLDLPKGETQGVQVEMKKSGFSLPKIGLSKSETKTTEADVSLPQVDVSLPGQDVKVEGPDANVNLTMGDIGEQDKLKFGSPTKFTLPTISLPKFGSKAKKESVDISGVDVQIKAPEISLPQTEVAVSSEPMSLNIKTPDIDKEIKSLTADIKAEDLKIEGQESKFKMPKFGISFPQVKGPKIDLHGGKTTDISLPEGKGEVHAPDVEGPDVKTEVKLDLPKGETQGVQVEMKKSGFSLPKIGLSKSETKTTEADVSLPQVDASLAEEDVKIEDINLAMGDTGKEDKPKFGSPTKFKLPTISFPKFGAKVTKEAEDISSVSAHMKGPDITLQQTELKVPADAIAVEIKGPHTDKQGKSLKVKPQDDQFEGQESKFKLPKFAISFPEVKGPKIELPASKTQTDIALPEVKAEVHVSAGEMKDVKSEEKGNLPEVDPKGLEVKAKKTGFSFPWFGFSKAETKAPKADITLPKVDVSLTKENVKIEETNTDVSLSIGDTGQEDKMKFGSPTKFKLPSISLPKFGAKSTKESVDISAAVDEQIQRSEIHLPEVEMSVSAEPLPVDIKVPERDKEGKSLSVETKTQTVEKEKKSKLPKFGISIPEVKGTKIDLHASKTQTDIALPEGKGEVHASDLEIPNIKSEVEVNLPEVDSKNIEIKMKKSGFSFPKFGFSKPETKAPEADVSVPPVDVSLPDENGKMEGSDVALSIDDTRQADETKFESPTKFKLPSMSFPKFRTKTSKAALDVSAVHVEVPRPEISQPEAQLKVSYELLSVDPKGPGVDKEGKSCMEMDIADIKPEINDHIKWKDSKAEAEIKDKVQQSPEAAVKHKEGSPSRFKPLTMKMPIITVSKSQLQDGQDDAVMSGAPEPKHKEITQGQEKSSKFTIPKFADVLRGFDVEFTVPKLDEIEQTKKETPTKQEHVTEVKGEDSIEGVTTNKGGAHEKSMLRFTFPKLRFNHPSDESDNIVNSEAVLENKLSSPTNTAKVNEQEDSQSPRKGHECPEVDIKAIGAEKSSTVEVEEDNVSPTLSLRSSEAFADLSAPTTEQVGLSLASPTKIKVKYSEPTIEVSDLHGDVITSTTSTELIFMEPHQPEKVNIPFSDESSSSSLNTLKQMSGEVHIIKSNVQTVPDTQHATILTYLGSQVIQTLPAEEMTIKSDSVLSVETHRVLKEEHTLIEKHVVEEILSDEKVLVTSRTQVFEGGVAEPITDDTASSIQKLKDIVHTEKMRFFEGAESGKKIIMISETSLRHADSSTDENEGK